MIWDEETLADIERLRGLPGWAYLLVRDAQNPRMTPERLVEYSELLEQIDAAIARRWRDDTRYHNPENRADMSLDERRWERTAARADALMALLNWVAGVGGDSKSPSPEDRFLRVVCSAGRWTIQGGTIIDSRGCGHPERHDRLVASTTFGPTEVNGTGDRLLARVRGLVSVLHGQHGGLDDDPA